MQICYELQTGNSIDTRATNSTNTRATKLAQTGFKKLKKTTSGQAVTGSCGGRKWGGEMGQTEHGQLTLIKAQLSESRV